MELVPIAVQSIRKPTLAGQLCCFAVLACLLGGCQTHRQIVDRAHQSFWQGDLSKSAADLNRAAARPRNDLTVIRLDQAMVEFQKGNFADSQRLLREVRDQTSPNALGRASSGAASFLLDDTTRLYEVEEHEKILLHVMLAMNSLLRGDGDATAYAHQIGEECHALLATRPVQPLVKATPASTATESVTPVAHLEPAAEQVPKIDSIRFELAVAPLLRAIVRSQSVLNQDDVVRNLSIANEWRPGSPFLERELEEAKQGLQPPTGYGRMYVLAFVGRGPRKVTSTEPVTSQAMLVADQILSAAGKYTLPPTVAPIKIARIELSPLSFDSLQVSVDGSDFGSTENIADIGRLAVERQNEMMPRIIGRAVARRVVKKSLIVVGKSASGAQKNSGNDLTSLLYTAAGVAWEAAEQADCRCWSLLPGSIQVLRVDLPAGSHQVRLRPVSMGRELANSFGSQVDIRDGEVCLAIASLSDSRGAGQLFLPGHSASQTPMGTPIETVNR